MSVASPEDKEQLLADARLARKGEDNLASFAGHMVERGLLPGGSIERVGDVTLIDSGIPDDTYNLILGADRLTLAGIHRAIDVARARRRPFAWWVASVPEQAELAGQLESIGLKVAEIEKLMTAALDREWPTAHQALQVRRVENQTELHAFAEIVASLWTPANPLVRGYFEKTSAEVLRADHPSELYLGYHDGRPVCTTLVHYAAGVAGVYNVATLADERRKGFARTVVAHALRAAREHGERDVILQASAVGSALYQSMGLRTIGEYREYSIAWASSIQAPAGSLTPSQKNSALNPGQQVEKIVDEELTNLMGGQGGEGGARDCLRPERSGDHPDGRSAGFG